MKYIKNAVIGLMFAGVVMIPSANAQTSSIEDMLAIIQSLMEQVEQLQEQLNTIRGEIKQVIRDGLAEGMTDEDIEKIQELLATDPAIYPEGLTTGYFGPLTKAALKRFQVRHEIKATGEIDEDTRILLEEYLHEGFGDTIPPGLLRAPGIAKKVELRIEQGCDNSGHGKGPLCKKLRIKFESEDDDSDEDEDDADEQTDEEKAEEAISDAQAKITLLEDALDGLAEDADGFDDASSTLATAQGLLEDAETAFDDEDYESAEELADDAKDAAEEGLTALGIDDDESDDDDDDSDDDDSDDDDSDDDDQS